MVTTVDPTALPPGESQGTPVNVTTDKMVQLRGWRRLFGSPNTLPGPLGSATSSNEYEEVKMKPEKWSLGVLNDKETDEVPGMYSHIFDLSTMRTLLGPLSLQLFRVYPAHVLIQSQ